MVENPRGSDSQERNLVRKNAIKNKAMMEEHFRVSRKFKDDPEILELIGDKPKAKETPKETKKLKE